MFNRLFAWFGSLTGRGSTPLEPIGPESALAKACRDIKPVPRGKVYTPKDMSDAWDSLTRGGLTAAMDRRFRETWTPCRIKYVPECSAGPAPQASLRA